MSKYNTAGIRGAAQLMPTAKHRESWFFGAALAQLVALLQTNHQNHLGHPGLLQKMYHPWDCHRQMAVSSTIVGLLPIDFESGFAVPCDKWLVVH